MNASPTELPGLPHEVASQNALLVNPKLTAYVLLAGMAAGMVLAVLVMVCWKVCIRKKKTRKRGTRDLALNELETGFSESWIQAAGKGTDNFDEDLQLKELPKYRNSVKGPRGGGTKHDQSSSSSPESPPEVTSVVRRRSSVGIQRQASVCLSDEEDQSYDDSRTVALGQHEPSQIQVTHVAAIVHPNSNEKLRDPSISSPPVRHYPFIHSHSTPDTESTAHVLQPDHTRNASTASLHGIPVDLAHVVDLEYYHYSRQQIWELASQGATLLKDKSQSSLDVSTLSEEFVDDSSQIQQAASTEGGLLEQSLEQHQHEHMRTINQRYSPFSDDCKISSKVRYNDIGSREDIHAEVIEMISGESSDDSNSSLESELLKQQSREIWELRATLEEDVDKLNDSQEADNDPQEHSDNVQEISESFAFSVDASYDDPVYECDESDYLQLPSHELRRHCYKSLLSKRLAKRGSGVESSFESVESSSTDRTECATTSFDSTTDNTDSTGEGQTNRLQQMKADSGYKSMESTGKAPRLHKKQLQFTLDGDSMDQTMTIEGTFEEECDLIYKDSEITVSDPVKTKAMEATKVVSFEGVTIEGEIPPSSGTQVSKKTIKSALKKHCTESDIQWSEQQIVSDLVAESRGKTSVFHRFFRSGRFRMDQLFQFRDYSIDEKSDALFREFSRTDMADPEYLRTKGARHYGHMRLHPRSLSSSESSSPHLPRTMLSPQQSIEEESCESGGEDKHPKEQEHAQIPVICLSQGGKGR